MSFLQQAEKIQTAQQIQAWINQANTSMQNAKECVIKLKTQRWAMVNNPEYSEEDINELDTAIISLISVANELING